MISETIRIAGEIVGVAAGCGATQIVKAVVEHAPFEITGKATKILFDAGKWGIGAAVGGIVLEQVRKQTNELITFGTKMFTEIGDSAKSRKFGKKIMTVEVKEEIA